MKWRFWNNKTVYQKLLILMVFLCNIALKSQDVVGSTAYSLVLKGLLSKKVPHLDVATLQGTLDTNIIFVDAREKKEFEVSHIADAIHVGYDSLDLSPLNNVDKSSPIIVYCSVGYRSEKVTQKLIAEGFTNVKNLYGGLFEWVNQDGVLVDSQDLKTDSIHAFSPAWGVWLKKGKKTY